MFDNGTIQDASGHPYDLLPMLSNTTHGELLAYVLLLLLLITSHTLLSMSYVNKLRAKVDPYLNRNATNYRNNHKHRDVVEIILHFINVKYRNMLTNINGNKPARAMIAYL